MADPGQLVIDISKKVNTSGSIMADIAASGTDVDTGVFVVARISDQDPAEYNNIRFLGVASAADYHAFGILPVFPGVYRTDKITIVVPSSDKYESFIAALGADLAKTVHLGKVDFLEEETVTVNDTDDISGPFFFGGVTP